MLVLPVVLVLVLMLLVLVMMAMAARSDCCNLSHCLGFSAVPTDTLNRCTAGRLDRKTGGGREHGSKEGCTLC